MPRWPPCCWPARRPGVRLTGRRRKPRPRPLPRCPRPHLLRRRPPKTPPFGSRNPMRLHLRPGRLRRRRRPGLRRPPPLLRAGRPPRRRRMRTPVRRPPKTLPFGSRNPIRRPPPRNRPAGRRKPFPRPPRMIGKTLKALKTRRIRKMQKARRRRLRRICRRRLLLGWTRLSGCMKKHRPRAPVVWFSS